MTDKVKWLPVAEVHVAALQAVNWSSLQHWLLGPSVSPLHADPVVPGLNQVTYITAAVAAKL